MTGSATKKPCPHCKKLFFYEDMKKHEPNCGRKTPSTPWPFPSEAADNLADLVGDIIDASTDLASDHD